MQLSLFLRNRDNQRRSRARRKDYVEDLETRAHQFEQEGVRISAEVQAAARKVAEENHLLRSLLALTGISAGEIEAYVHRMKTPDESSAQITPKAFTKSGQSRHAKDLACPPPSPYTTRAVLSEMHQPNKASKDYELLPSRRASTMRLDRGSRRDATTSPDLPSMCQRHQLGENNSGSNADGLFSEDSQSLSPLGSAPDALDRQSVTSSGMADKTLCDNAARIIASMRGHDDSEAVRSELGCSFDDICVVKNVTIFQLVDQ